MPSRSLRLLLVLHGPNLPQLAEAAGTRLADIDAALHARAAALGLQLHVVSSNHEGALLDALHAQGARAVGVLVSPGALALGGHALAEGLALARLPAVEVHPGPVRRGRRSLLRGVCLAHVAGKGAAGYLLALERLARAVPAAAPDAASPKAAGDAAGDAAETASEAASDDAAAARAPSQGAPAGKTLGRKPVNRLKERAQRGEVAKTLGRKPAAKRSAAPPARTNTLAARTLGRAAHLAGEDEAAQLVSRASVRQKVAERLAGRLSPAALATWARGHLLDVQRGAAVESGQRELLEDVLQRLTLSTLPPSRLTDEQLIELMTELDT
ncbi:3-dehydroquinate dehydratase [Aggregicoccus sp. 17bor-14]|uniref:type II 3-dehydroquinate dehydratase n=1 Tax=Myxococcaceae TaxID=31 RepID=UPI00129CD448|nr:MULTISPECIES: type II 3-dehydroquinate dehydratase [Myxococcaceae]MBF5043656.1 type II 3-dehydroquinate dehydratase [Simulacricoccus sp. 17bor-14]MRI89415.1 3-dehydroquinate dehydratase [Aggregicoccus sp. 17bor-14]